MYLKETEGYATAQNKQVPQEAKKQEWFAAHICPLIFFPPFGVISHFDGTQGFSSCRRVEACYLGLANQMFSLIISSAGSDTETQGQMENQRRDDCAESQVALNSMTLAGILDSWPLSFLPVLQPSILPTNSVSVRLAKGSFQYLQPWLT